MTDLFAGVTGLTFEASPAKRKKAPSTLDRGDGAN
jgi:hypothetical protein